MASKNVDRLVYVSRAQPSFQTAELEPLLEKARINNDRNGLTGLLLARSGCFIQVLEGERFNLAYTFKKIRDDARHHSVRILLETSSDARMYSRWRMAFRDLDVADSGLLETVDNVMKSRKVSESDVNLLFKKISSKL